MCCGHIWQRQDVTSFPLRFPPNATFQIHPPPAFRAVQRKTEAILCLQFRLRRCPNQQQQKQYQSTLRYPKYPAVQSASASIQYQSCAQHKPKRCFQTPPSIFVIDSHTCNSNILLLLEWLTLRHRLSNTGLQVPILPRPRKSTIPSPPPGHCAAVPSHDEAVTGGANHTQGSQGSAITPRSMPGKNGVNGTERAYHKTFPRADGDTQILLRMRTDTVRPTWSSDVLVISHDEYRPSLQRHVRFDWERTRPGAA